MVSGQGPTRQMKYEVCSFKNVFFQTCNFFFILRQISELFKLKFILHKDLCVVYLRNRKNLNLKSLTEDNANTNYETRVD